MFACHSIQYLATFVLLFNSWIYFSASKVQADAIDFEFNGRTDADIVKYENALKAQPNSVLLHLQLGQLLLDQKGDVDKAIVQFKAALKAQSPCGSCQVRLERAQLLKESSGDELILDGNQYYLNKQYKRADALYRIAVHNDPKNPQTHNCLAWTLYKEGSLEEGLKEVRLALYLKADDPEFINTLGCLLYDSGHPDAALASWRKAVSLSAKPSAADLYGIAVALMTQGSKDEAKKYFEQALQEDSKYADLNYLSDRIGLSVKTLSMHDCLLALIGSEIPKDKAAR